MLQKAHGLGATDAGAAMHNHFLAGIQLVHAPRKIVERDQDAVEVADLVLMRLPYVKQDKVLFRVKTLLQFFHADFRHAVGHWFLLSSQSAELFVINEFSHSGMGSANHAVRIL